MSRPVLRAGGLTRQRLSLLWCKESLCFAFHKGSIPAERFPYAAKFLFTTKSPLLQNLLCCKIPFATKSPLLQNSLCYKIPFAAKFSLLQNPFCCKIPLYCKIPLCYKIFFAANSLLLQRARRFPKGDRKALWAPPQRRNPP